MKECEEKESRWKAGINIKNEKKENKITHWWGKIMKIPIKKLIWTESNDKNPGKGF